MSLDYLVLSELVSGYPDDLPGWAPMGVSANGRYVLSVATGFTRNFWILDRQNDSFTTYIDGEEWSTFTGGAIEDDGSIYFTAGVDPSAVYHWTDLEAPVPTTPLYTVPGSSSSTVPKSLRLFIMPDDAKKLVWLLIDNADAPDNLVYVYDIATDSGSAVSWTANAPHGIIQDSYGDVWAFGRVDSGTIRFKRVVDGGEGTAADDVVDVEVPYTSGQEIQVLHTSAGWVVVADNGKKLYLLDDADFSILEQRDYATTGSSLNNWTFGSNFVAFLMVAPGLDEFWMPGPNSFDDFPATGTVSDVCRITAADLTTVQTLDVHDWEISDTPGRIRPVIMYTSYGRKALISMSYEEPSDDPPLVADWTPVIRYLPDEGGQTGDPTLRVWGFSLDGHDFYCLRLGDGETLVFDLTTQQWASWASPSRDNWRVTSGQNWVGAAATTIGRGWTDIVAGDDTEGLLWILDPSTGRDDNVDSGTSAFTRTVTGGVTLSGRQTVPCGAVTLNLSLGNPAMDGASITLRTSDDQGQSWTDHGAITVGAADYSAVVEWRALGLIRAPGRVFEFSDNGAVVRISSADMR